MRVVHVLGRLSLGGTERQLVGMLRSAALHEVWEPSVVLLRDEAVEQLKRELTDAGVPVTAVPATRRYDLTWLLSVRRAILAEHADVIHSSLWGANVVTRAALALPSRPPVVLSERRVEYFRPRWQRYVDRSLRRNADLYVGNSREVEEFIQQWHDVPTRRTRRVHNGIDPAVFHPRSSDDVSLSAGERPLVVAAMGRLIAVKGFQTVIAGFARLVSDHASMQFELRVAGDGPDRTRLEALAQGLPVQFVGQIPQPTDVAAFLRGADVFVHMSAAEGLPNVVLEARACGVPVIVSDGAGMSEAAPGAPLVAAGDADALAAALTQLALNKRSGASGRDLGMAGVPTFREVAGEHYRIFNEAASLRGH